MISARTLLGQMTGWARGMRPAKFRDAVFYVENYGGTTGRRGVDHEYPSRDTPFSEDLGRSQRVWNFTGYVLGDNYPSLRDRLIKAAEQEGPGELVHPTIGTVQAVCRSCQYAEERERGRYCAFTLEFREAGQLREPTDAEHPETAVENAAEPLGTVSQDSFLSTFSAPTPWLQTHATNDVGNLAQTLQILRLPSPTTHQSALGQALDYMTRNAGSLAANPSALAGHLNTTFGLFTDAGEAPHVVSSMLQLSKGPQPAARTAQGLTPWVELEPEPERPSGRLAHTGIDIPFTLQSAERRRANEEAFEDYVCRLAVRELGYAVPGLELDNYDEAIRVLREISDAFRRLEEMAADSGEDDVFIALINLRAALTRYISAAAVNLNPMVTYRVISITPANSLTLAWRLYQDSGRDEEVVSRTGARSPPFLPMQGRVLAPRPIWEWQPAGGRPGAHTRGRLT